MRRADRLFQIVQYLRGGRLLTAQMLAERLAVTKRTVYRDVADRIGSGVPIEGEAGARMIRAWGGAQMAAAAEEALVKIKAVLPEDARARRRRADPCRHHGRDER